MTASADYTTTMRERWITAEPSSMTGPPMAYIHQLAADFGEEIPVRVMDAILQHHQYFSRLKERPQIYVRRQCERLKAKLDAEQAERDKPADLSQPFGACEWAHQAVERTLRQGYGTRFEAARLEAFKNIFGDHPAKDIIRAAEQCLLYTEFLPSVADLGRQLDAIAAERQRDKLSWQQRQRKAEAERLQAIQVVVPEYERLSDQWTRRRDEMAWTIKRHYKLDWTRWEDCQVLWRTTRAWMDKGGIMTEAEAIHAAGQALKELNGVEIDAQETDNSVSS